MADLNCPTCGGPLERGFLSTTNGSGLFWSHENTGTRLRPKGLEVVVPTGFMGTYSANAQGSRCRACGFFQLHLNPKDVPK
ncbi:MAG: PF20097 family protein [Thermoplasmata archaeon]